MKWYCLGCGWGAIIETWETRIGTRYLCRCGLSGRLEENDAPKFLNEEEQKDNESDYDFVKRVWI